MPVADFSASQGHVLIDKSDHYELNKDLRRRPENPLHTAINSKFYEV